MRLRRWYCSPASFPSPSKKVSKRSEAAKEKKTMAVKSFVQRYMLTYPRVFPKPTEVQRAVGGSWNILKEILAEIKAEMHQIDQQTASTSLVADASVAKEVDGIMGSSTVNMREGRFVTLTEMLNAAKSRTVEDKNPTGLASVESSKKRQETMQDFTISGSVANQPLFRSINQIAGAEERKKETTVTTFTNRHSFKAKSYFGALSPCRSEDYARRVGGMASNHDSLAPDQRTSELDLTAPQSLPRLVQFFTRRAEKIRFDRPNDNTLKKVTPVNFREEGSGSLENSKKHSNLSYMSTGKIMKQDEYSKHKKLHCEESNMRPGVKSLLDRSTELTREDTTVTTVTNRQSFKAKSFDDASSPCRSDDYARRVCGMASNQDSLALDQRTSELDKTSPRNLPTLVELFTRRADKIRFDCPNDNTLKKVTPVNFHEKDSGSLENLQRHLSGMFTGKIMKQDEYLKHKKLHSEESKMRPGVESCLDRSTELTRDTPKAGPWANESSNKIKLLSKEVSPGNSIASAVQILTHLDLNDQHTSGSQLEKKQANEPYGVIESEENEDANCPKLERILLDKDKKAMNTSDGLNSLVISDESDSDISAFEYPSPEPNNEVRSSTKGFHLNTNQNDRELAHNNRLLVYFVPKTAKVKDLIQTFGDSGFISEIQILPSRENRFNYAHIFFETEEGLRKALSKTDVAVDGADVATEVAITPSEIRNRMLCTEQVNNADFPEHFLKYPNRTVIINGLPDNLSFHHLKCALSTWGRITGIAMGASVSTVFIEFESEKSKERALAEATISISGTRLSILRVDAPKTTIVRISNVNPVSRATRVHLICDSFGQVKRVVDRYIDTFDVHFKLSEWPNMLKIINRLNGLEVLWNRPGGRKQVHELVRNLCERITDESIDTSPLLDLAEEYC